MVVYTRRCLLLCLMLSLGSCSWFGGGDDESKEPKKLTPISSEIEIDKVWDERIGRGAEDKVVKLVPALSGSRVFAAAPDGHITALEKGSGDTIWEVEVQDFYTDEERSAAFPEDMDAITGGVGLGGDLVVVGTVAGQLVALNQSDGSLAWRTRTSSEVLAPPQVNQDLVIAQSIDGKVAAYNALDGTRQWLYTTSVPSLTLRGTATPVLLSNVVIVGFANGRVMALSTDQGLPVMDERVAIPQGQSDLERLVDIDGAMVVEGSQLFVASYQGNLAAIDLGNRKVRWTKEASSINGLGSGFGNVYISFANSHLGAYDMQNSHEIWEVDALEYRDITAPVAISSYLVVGDFEGYIHFVAQSDGRFVGRRHVDGEGITAPPVVDGNRVYIMGDSGRLSVFEIR